MASGMIVAGLGIAAVGIGGRFVLRNWKVAATTINKQLDAAGVSLYHVLDNADLQTFSKYYKGGFDAKMSRREASLILGVSPSAPASKVKEAHKRIMLLNHPDRGGSPYIAAKINEAKDYIESKKA